MAVNLLMISLNVAGLNNPIKNWLLANMIPAEWATLVFFQKMHLRTSEEWNLKEFYRGIIYHVRSPTRSKGAMLRISKNLPWKCKIDRVDADPAGRYIIYGSLDTNVDGDILYVPNVRHMEFWEHLWDKLLNGLNIDIIAMGEFNAAINRVFDNSKGTKNSWGSEGLSWFCENS